MTKHTLEQIEAAVSVLTDMDYEQRKQFIKEVDQLKGFKGEALDERISKASLTDYATLRIVY